MGLPDDNPSSFGDHCGMGRHSGLDGLASSWQDLPLLVQLFSAKNLLMNSHQAHQIAAHPFHHLPMGLPDDNPSSFGDHCGMGRHSGLDGLASSCLLARFAASCPTFSAKNLLINSHQAQQIAAHPFHHLPMGLPDDNPSSFGDHIVAWDIMLGWMDYSKLFPRFATSCPTFFSQKPPDQQPSSTTDCCSSLILFIISQWVYQMIIQAHLGIIVAWDVILGWMN
jgi:hypothetical protein